MKIECDICGKKRETKLYNYDGSVIRICEECNIKYGKEEQD